MEELHVLGGDSMSDGLDTALQVVINSSECLAETKGIFHFF